MSCGWFLVVGFAFVILILSFFPLISYNIGKWENQNDWKCCQEFPVCSRVYNKPFAIPFANVTCSHLFLQLCLLFSSFVNWLFYFCFSSSLCSLRTLGVGSSMTMSKERESSADQNSGDVAVAFQISEWVSELPADTRTLMKFHCTTKHVDLTWRKQCIHRGFSCLSWICESFGWFDNTCSNNDPPVGWEMCRKIWGCCKKWPPLVGSRRKSHKRHFSNWIFQLFKLKSPLRSTNYKDSGCDMRCVLHLTYSEQLNAACSKLRGGTHMVFDVDCWSFGVYSSFVLHVEMVFGKLWAGGIVGMEKKGLGGIWINWLWLRRGKKKVWV